MIVERATMTLGISLMLENGMRTALCLQISDRDCKGSEIKWVMEG